MIARGWLTTSNAHRDLVIELALAGHGVVRILDWTELPDLASGSLVRALADWESTEAPPVNLDRARPKDSIGSRAGAR